MKLFIAFVVCWIQDLWLSLVRSFRKYRMQWYKFKFSVVHQNPNRVLYARATYIDKCDLCTDRCDHCSDQYSDQCQCSDKSTIQRQIDVTYLVKKFYKFDPTLSIYTLGIWLQPDIPKELYLVFVHENRIYTVNIDMETEVDTITKNEVSDMEFSELRAI